MTIAVSPEDRLRGERPNRRIGDLLISLAAALALHLLVFVLFFVEILVAVDAPVAMSETPVEIVAEIPPVPPPQATPNPPAPQPQATPNPPAAAAPPPLADEEKKSNAPKAASNQNGEGGDHKDEGAPTGSTEKAQSGKTPPLPLKPDAAEAASDQKDVEARQKPRIAPLGPQRIAATAKDPDPSAKDAEAAKKRDDIHCDPNAPHPHTSGAIRQGLVVGALSPDQALDMIERTQAHVQMYISPDYIANPRILVHVDGSPPGASATVLLPTGMQASPGERVEFRGSRLDPERPCHYIPNLALRVL